MDGWIDRYMTYVQVRVTSTMSEGLLHNLNSLPKNGIYALFCWTQSSMIHPEFIESLNHLQNQLNHGLFHSIKQQINSSSSPLQYTNQYPPSAFGQTQEYLDCFEPKGWYMDQNISKAGTLINLKIADKWMFIPPNKIYWVLKVLIHPQHQ